MTSKTDVYAFGVVLAELVTGQRALARDIDTNKVKSLASTVSSCNKNTITVLIASSDLILFSSFPFCDLDLRNIQ